MATGIVDIIAALAIAGAASVLAVPPPNTKIEVALMLAIRRLAGRLRNALRQWRTS